MIDNKHKYEIVKSILKNGDICEMQTYENNIIFGIYMDDHLYITQKNMFVAELGGFEQNVIAIRRPQSMRNAFQCFKDGDIYNYDYTKYGSFDTVYTDENKSIRE
jgi:hypothetical protein